METFNTILAIILVMITLTSKRLQIIYMILLSWVTAYIASEYFCPVMRLWSQQEYTWSNIYFFIETGKWVYFLILVFSMYAVFYMLLYAGINYLIESKLKQKYDRYILKLKSDIDLTGQRFVKIKMTSSLIRYVKFLKKIGVKFSEKENKEMNFNNFKNQISMVICMLLHTILSFYLLGFRTRIIIILSCILILGAFILIVIVIPASRYLMDKTKKIIENEYH